MECGGHDGKIGVGAGKVGENADNAAVEDGCDLDEGATKHRGGALWGDPRRRRRLSRLC